MLKTVPISYSPTRGYYVNLPTYNMVQGTWEPVTPNLLHANGAYPKADPMQVLALNPTCIVEIPDYIPMDESGNIDPVPFAEVYKNHPYFGTTHYTPPALTEPDPGRLAALESKGIIERVFDALRPV